MTLEELIAFTTIQECPKCKLKHSTSRSCEETIHANAINVKNKGRL